MKAIVIFVFRIIVQLAPIVFFWFLLALKSEMKPLHEKLNRDDLVCIIFSYYYPLTSYIIMAMIKRSCRCYNLPIKRSDRNVQCTVEEVVTFCRSAKTS